MLRHMRGILRYRTAEAVKTSPLLETWTRRLATCLRRLGK